MAHGQRFQYKKREHIFVFNWMFTPESTAHVGKNAEALVYLGLLDWSDVSIIADYMAMRLRRSDIECHSQTEGR